MSLPVDTYSVGESGISPPHQEIVGGQRQRAPPTPPPAHRPSPPPLSPELPPPHFNGVAARHAPHWLADLWGCKKQQTSTPPPPKEKGIPDGGHLLF